MSEGWAATMRWDPYLLAEGSEFDTFWRTHLKSREREVLLVIGRGFDQRAMQSLGRFREFGLTPEVWLVSFDNGREDSDCRKNLIEANYKKLVELVTATNILDLPVKIGGRSAIATSRNTTRAIRKLRRAGTFDDVVIDISAMPRMVALSAIATLIYNLDKQREENGKETNLHVVAAESVPTDLAAKGSLMDEMTSLVGFSGRLNEQSTEDVPRVWFPILGEEQSHRLELIRDRLDPDEICPVVPFPSRSPSRGDQIVSAHGELLFEVFGIEPSNILRASEFNPFEAYRQLFLAMDWYRRALDKLGGCKAFVSPLSSKLLSVGALLACYDHTFGNVRGPRLTVGIPYVETAEYADPTGFVNVESKLYSMWISGEWER